ncbi:2-iminobutanoate/2-iminopropanoate deaminase-like [Bicyclus anynana]|uniref:2-iminobutanoate/2-iminopropanoate deaminase-like n=1 Tax=Bicyclus anynana TaxID=110368 RepID=A0ABM3LRS0_BICAN|nr:2-iminobutanoate/2-iminopropanoate deaminase-like [Bicyclus anynana]
MSSHPIVNLQANVLSESLKMSKPNTDLQNKVTKTIITSPYIYKPVGPYSQAIKADKTLYLSGVLGLDPEARLVTGGAEAQTRQALDNMKQVLYAGGSSLEAVVKTTVLLVNMDDFQVFNKVYAEYFSKDCPARSTYQVSKLPLGAAVEIEAVALCGDLVIEEMGTCPCARI